MKPALKLRNNRFVIYSSKKSCISSKKKLFPEKNEGKSSEKSLWKAVIMQAVLDIMNSSSRTENIVARKEAILWFNVCNINFTKVCEYADLNPEWVLKKVRFALKYPTTWRRPCDLKNFVFAQI